MSEDDSATEGDKIRRRTVLTALGGTAAASLAGCSGLRSDIPRGASRTTTTVQTTTDRPNLGEKTGEIETGPCNEKLEFLNHTATFKGDRVAVNGSFKNVGNSALTSVRIIVRLYDDDEEVSTNNKVNTLIRSGDQSNYSVEFPDTDAGSFSRYVLRFEC